MTWTWTRDRHEYMTETHTWHRHKHVISLSLARGYSHTHTQRHNQYYTCGITFFINIKKKILHFFVSWVSPYCIPAAPDVFLTRFAFWTRRCAVFECSKVQWTLGMSVSPLTFALCHAVRCFDYSAVTCQMTQSVIRAGLVTCGRWAAGRAECWWVLLPTGDKTDVLRASLYKLNRSEWPSCVI